MNKGCVYILTNPSFKENIIKIGKSSREVDIRMKELDNTSTPESFQVYAVLLTEKYNEVEKTMHNTLTQAMDNRVRDNREFFEMSPEHAFEILKDIGKYIEDSELRLYINPNEEISNYQFSKFAEISYEDSLKFGKHQENRTISPIHVKELKEQFLIYKNVMPPIIINEVTNNIIDGQHRLQAFQELHQEFQLAWQDTIRVMFVNLKEDVEKGLIINANTNSKKWTQDDFIDSFIKANNNNYILLESFCKSHPLFINKKKFKFRAAAYLLNNKVTASEVSSGSFVVTQEQINTGEIIYNQLVDIIDSIVPSKSLSGPGFEALIKSWTNPKYKLLNFDIWKSLFKKYKKTMITRPQQTVQDWNNIFNELYMSTIN